MVESVLAMVVGPNSGNGVPRKKFCKRLGRQHLSQIVRVLMTC